MCNQDNLYFILTDNGVLKATRKQCF